MYSFNINNPSSGLDVDLDADSGNCSFFITSVGVDPNGVGANISIIEDGSFYNDEEYYTNRWEKQLPWTPPRMHISNLIPVGTYVLTIFYQDNGGTLE